ncbi:uncharacterized protein LOC108623800, partial [Ceratina calcarata]|uniref:Uncharacterized protein LOC108623800 n=1 Tax=Ceratina calcarata TaxID=156304 RepID=A0AAJ7W9Y1_9HYME
MTTRCYRLPPRRILSIMSRRITATMVTFTLRFVMELSEDKYNLIGPYAISVNQFTCANDRRDCLLSASIKKPKRRRRDDDHGDCGCTNGRPRRRRRVSTNQSRRSGRQQEDHEDCNCSVILTDEDDCGCEGEVARAASRRQTLQDIQRNDRPVDEERQTATIREPLEATRRNNENRTTENNGHEIAEQ